MRHWFFCFPISVKFNIGVNVLDLIFVENALSTLDLRVNGKKGPGSLVSSQVGDHTCQMRKSDKALGHATAFVIDEDKCHLMRMII